MTTQHSPLPWVIARPRFIRDRRGDNVANAISPRDAERIIAAVNNHADLLAALKAIVKMPIGPSERNGATHAMTRIAEAALVKANGRSEQP